MDMGIIYLHFRAFCHDTEDEAKVVQAMGFVTGLEEFDRNATEGHHGNKIIILEGQLREKKMVRRFFDSLSKEDLQLLIDTMDSRLDDECFLYARVDKQQAFLGKVLLTIGDDAIHVRAKIESYPRKREVAFKSAIEFLEKALHEKD